MKSQPSDEKVYKNPLWNPVPSRKNTISSPSHSDEKEVRSSRKNSTTDEIVYKNPLYQMMKNEEQFFQETQESRTRSYTLNRHTTKKLEQLVKQTQAKEWIKKVLPDVVLTEDFVADIKDGVILCRLMNKIKPGISN